MWWKKYFNFWNEIQSSVKTDDITKREVDFIEDYVLGFDKSLHILDVPCGQGRVCLELGKRGYKAKGIEYNKASVLYGKEQIKTLGLEKKVSIVNGDMRKLKYNQKFDVVLCLYNSFGYFPEEENEQFLKGVADALKPGGLFLLDNHILESILPNFSPRSVWRAGKYFIIEDRIFDHTDTCMKGNWQIGLDDEYQYYQTVVRFYSYKELTKILKKYGFVDFETYSDYKANPFETGDDALLLVAKKGSK